jgi:opacity protein-like surface antigen
MTRRTCVAVAVVVLVMSRSAVAQTFEVSGLAGYTPSVEIDRRARELDQLDLTGGFTWGVQVGVRFTPRWGAEVLWMQQSTALELGTSAGATDLFTATATQLHGNVVYQFGAADARMQPFVFGGLGATFFDADDVLPETKFSLGFGAGIKYFPWRRVGVRGHFRYKPTMVGDDSDGDFCDPFGFCQGSLQQIEIAAGAVVRF